MALALSGGSDSLALLYVAAEWARSQGRRLLALTVDHRLHPESAAWTRFAGDAAERVGADWRAIAWDADKPLRGLPAAARSARHRLLADAARAAGARVVLFGHTLDDVYEEGLMRQDGAPSLPPLREWGPSPVWPEGRGVFLLRPLLEARRSALRDLLRQLGETWIEDPANADPRFTRARARLAAAARPQRGAPFAARQDTALGDLAKLSTVTPDGRVVIGREYLRDGAPAVIRRFIAAALLCASGTERPPRGHALERLTSRLQAAEPFTATLCGARVTGSALSVTFGREAGEQSRGGLAPRPLQPLRSTVWDGRFEVRADEPGLTAAAVRGYAQALSEADERVLRTFAASARPALPALLGESGVSLPRPFGGGRGEVEALAGRRLRAASGLVQREAQV